LCAGLLLDSILQSIHQFPYNSYYTFICYFSLPEGTPEVLLLQLNCSMISYQPHKEIQIVERNYHGFMHIYYTYIYNIQSSHDFQEIFTFFK
jgi:hypothetical protein